MPFSILHNTEESERSLFVGDLASFVTEQHMQEIFRQEGFDIVNAKLMRGKQSLSSLSYGFVLMKSKTDAIRAISALDSKLVYGRTLRVKWARPNLKENKNSEYINSVYVKFQMLSPESSVTEETLRYTFSYFGVVTDVSVKTSTINQMNGARDSGYGFVHFENGSNGVLAAFKAIKFITSNPIINNVQYTCEASQNLLKNIEIMENANARNYFDKKQQSQQLHTPLQQQQIQQTISKPYQQNSMFESNAVSNQGYESTAPGQYSISNTNIYPPQIPNRFAHNNNNTINNSNNTMNSNRDYLPSNIVNDNYQSNMYNANNDSKSKLRYNNINHLQQPLSQSQYQQGYVPLNSNVSPNVSSMSEQFLSSGYEHLSTQNDYGYMNNSFPSFQTTQHSRNNVLPQNNSFYETEIMHDVNEKRNANCTASNIPVISSNSQNTNLQSSQMINEASLSNGSNVVRHTNRTSPNLINYQTSSPSTTSASFATSTLLSSNNRSSVPADTGGSSRSVGSLYNNIRDGTHNSDQGLSQHNIVANDGNNRAVNVLSNHQSPFLYSTGMENNTQLPPRSGLPAQLPYDIDSKTFHQPTRSIHSHPQQQNHNDELNWLTDRTNQLQINSNNSKQTRFDNDLQLDEYLKINNSQEANYSGSTYVNNNNNNILVTKSNSTPKFSGLDSSKIIFQSFQSSPSLYTQTGTDPAVTNSEVKRKF